MTYSVLKMNSAGSIAKHRIYNLHNDRYSRSDIDLDMLQISTKLLKLR